MGDTCCRTAGVEALKSTGADQMRVDFVKSGMQQFVAQSEVLPRQLCRA